jgi:hypothetical protein
MHKFGLLVSLVAVLLAPINLRAAYVNISIPNHSFELPGIAKQQCWDGEKLNSTDIPGWSSDVVALNSGVEMGPDSTNGSWMAYLMGSEEGKGDPSIWNLLPHFVKAGDEFVLSVDARDNYNANTMKMSFYYLGPDGQRITVATKTVELTSTFKTYILRFAADNMPDSIGHQIGIELDNPSTGWLGIDNIQIPFSSTPNSAGYSNHIKFNSTEIYGGGGSISDGGGRIESEPIPEPSTIVFLIAGILALVLKKR